MLRLGVTEIPPLALVMLRQTIATVAFAASVLALRRRLLWSAQVWRDIAVVATLTTILPVIFFTMALEFVSSAVASIILALVPLLTGLMAHLLLHDERLSRFQAAGLVVAFIGVVLLILTGTSGIAISGGSVVLRGYLLLLAAALALASAGIYTRKHLQNIDVLVITAGQTALSLLVALPLALIVSPFDPAAVTLRGWLAVAWSGLLDSFAGFFLFFYMIQRFGPTLATLPIYVTPVASTVLGALLLQELINAPLLTGSILVLAGVYLASQSRQR
jgi:drug/metabolite transporter (DMT)-like permease